MAPDYKSIKVTTETYKLIKLMCAVRGETVITLIARLTLQEFDQMQAAETKSPKK